MNTIFRLRKKNPNLTAPYNPEEDMIRPAPTERPDYLRSVPAPRPDMNTSISMRPSVPLETMPEERPPTITPLQRARRGLTEAENEPLTFGTNKAGEVQYAPKKGLLGRIKAGGKALAAQLPTMLATGGPIGTLLQAPAVFGQGVIDPSEPAKIRRRKHIAEAQGQYQREAGRAKVEGEIAQDEAQTANLIAMPERLKREETYKARQQELAQQREDARQRMEVVKEEGRNTRAAEAIQARPEKSVVPDVGAQNAPDIKGLRERLTGYEAELQQHKNSIAVKNAAIKKQAEGDYQAAVTEYNAAVAAGQKPLKPKRADFYEEARNNDPDYLDGTVEKVTNRIKELEEARKFERGNLDQLETEVRKANQKAAPGVAAKPAKDGKFHYTTAQIRAALQPGQTYEEILAKLKANSKVVIDE